MIEVFKTPVFLRWMARLQDRQARNRITARIERMALGNMGDVAPVGEGVSELRIHYGPGYRVYLTRKGNKFIILLCGGDKKTQEKDIRAAKELAAELKGQDL